MTLLQHRVRPAQWLAERRRHEVGQPAELVIHHGRHVELQRRRALVHCGQTQPGFSDTTRILRCHPGSQTPPGFSDTARVLRHHPHSQVPPGFSDTTWVLRHTHTRVLKHNPHSQTCLDVISVLAAYYSTKI